MGGQYSVWGAIFLLALFFIGIPTLVFIINQPLWIKILLIGAIISVWVGYKLVNKKIEEMTREASKMFCPYCKVSIIPNYIFSYKRPNYYSALSYMHEPDHEIICPICRRDISYNALERARSEESKNKEILKILKRSINDGED